MSMVASVLCLFSCYLLSATSAKDFKPKQLDTKSPFALSVSPHTIIAHRNKPVHLRVIVRNVSGKTKYIWFLLMPAPFGSSTSMGCLMTRCRNQETGKEVQYKWDHLTTSQDVKGKELTDKFPPGSYNGGVIDLLDWCDLPIGTYTVEMQFETQHIPSWVKPDKKAWHGMTNKVILDVHIVK